MNIGLTTSEPRTGSGISGMYIVYIPICKFKTQIGTQS